MPGALALPSKCLRCQLHAAVWQNRILRNGPRHIAQRCKAFSTHHSRSQETVDLQFRARIKGGTKWRSVALSDENHAARPRPIIVLDDVPKGKDKTKDKSRQGEDSTLVRKIVQKDADPSPTAKQIESVVNERNKAPAQAEVNESLETMRLEATRKSTVISTSKFEGLLQDLAKSYTLHQLGRYLDRSIKSPSNKVYELQTSAWRPGKTPIEQRLPKEVRKKGPSTKLRAAEQILRLIWEITVESEENRDGELEMRLKPWQTSLLFDLTSDGARYLNGLVTPQTLIQNSDIQLYRPDNVMRITGRCQTAEEIARQLKLALLKVHRLDMDPKPLAVSLESTQVMPSTIFRPEDISYVAQLTESVIVPEHDRVLAIYCTSRSGQLNARRLLLALLDQDRGSFTGTATIVDGPSKDAFQIPIGNSNTGIHRRYHGLELSRSAAPVAVRIGDFEGFQAVHAEMDDLATSLAPQLDQVKPPRLLSTLGPQTDSYWRDHCVASDWEAKYCTLVHTKDEPSMAGSNVEVPVHPQSVIQHGIPGLENLLPYFNTSQPARAAGRKSLPYVQVHLKPSPQDLKTNSALPRLELRLHFTEPRTGKGPRELVLTGFQAIIDEQRLSVPSPGYATDLQFIRKSKLLAKLDAVKADASIMSFVRHVQKSARNEKGALTAPSELSIKLPSEFAKDKEPEASAATQDVTVKYLFERLEQIQKLEFKPCRGEELDDEMDPDLKSTLQALPKDLRLDYREVEGGAIFGNSTVLSLDFDRRHQVARSSTAGEEASEQTHAGHLSLELAGAALRIAHLLTRANCGSLKHSSERMKGS